MVRWILPQWLIWILNGFYTQGTQLGNRCSGFGVYPNSQICWGCDDCKDKRYGNPH
jgi:hypothetical protein